MGWRESSLIYCLVMSNLAHYITCSSMVFYKLKLAYSRPQSKLK